MKNMNSKKGKLISIMGPPCSGKSTLASDVHTQLKKRGFNSVFVGEAATDFIAEWGVPSTPQDQMVIYYKQLNREKMFLDSKDFVICDSSSLLNYFYFRGLFPKYLTNKDIAAINHIQKEILKNLSMWNEIFFVPPIDTESEDGIRFHNDAEIMKLSTWIKSYLEIENITHHDLTEIVLEKRIDFILDKILN